jgi:Flp pilus assembly protein TadB
VAAEAGGVGQLASLETSGLRGAAGERNGAVAVAIGWASSGRGHTGGFVVLLILAAVILIVVVLILVVLIVVVLVIVRVVLVGAAVLEVVVNSGGRSGSRRSGLQLRCVSTQEAPRHKGNQYIPQ